MKTKINFCRRKYKGMNRLRHELVVISILLLIGILIAPSVRANPKDGKVVNGSAQFNTQGNTLTITNTPNAIINWKSFSIDANETTRFVQQNSSSSVLNRIKGQDPSVILGSLQSNGKVLLINPNGIIFGQGSRVDVNGLIASTLNISNQDFLNGKYNFNAGDITGKIQNQGTITTPTGGLVYLIAPDIENSGIINTPKGEVILAAGHSVQLFDSLDPNISVVVSAPADKAVNLGQIIAESGKVGIYGGLINQKGTINADSAVVGENGKIFFKATKDITLDTGSITSAKGGEIKILGGMEDGTVKVAGTIDASAPNGGDGGFIETSAAKVKIEDSAKVTTLAPHGKTGTWLVDPTNFNIEAGSGAPTTSGIGADTLADNLVTTGFTVETDASGTEAGDINVNADVTWSTHPLSLQAHGDININAILKANNANLDLRAGYSTPGTDGGTYNGTNSVKVGFNPDGTFKGRVDFFQADGTTPRSGAGFLTINGNGYTVITDVGAANHATLGGDTLQGMAYTSNLSGNYALGSNIDASATSGWNGVSGFQPIGDSSNSFTGTFDGLGHTVTGLYINRPTTDYVGLFGFAIDSSKIRNVGMVDMDITGQSYVGGLVGFSNGIIDNSYSESVVGGTVHGIGYVGGLVGMSNWGGSISNSHSNVTVTGTGDYVGGLAGRSDGSITNSYNVGTVSGGNYVGGLVGDNEVSPITSSYNMGVVNGTGNYVGGLAGENKASDISNSYNTGAVTGNDQVGGLVGYSHFPDVASFCTISSSYNTGSVTGQNDVGGLVGSNSQTHISNSRSEGAVTGTGLDVGGLVGINYSSNINNSHHSIGEVSGTDEVGGLVGENYGTFDGNAVITNSSNTAAVSGANYVGGLVGSNYGESGRAEIRDSRNEGNVTGTGNDVGGLAGDSYAYGDPSHTGVPGGVLIINSYNTGVVTTTGSYVGGLVGYHWGEGGSASEINNSYSTGAVSGVDYVGGLVGNNDFPDVASSCTITSSYSTGNVTGQNNVGGLVGLNTRTHISNSHNAGSVSGVDHVGGLVGDNELSNIDGSYSEGAVTGGNDVGGLAGINYGDISQSNSTGVVTGTGDYVGGLVGMNQGNITNSYSTGTASGNNSVGGLVGYHDGEGGPVEIDNCYSTVSVNGNWYVGGLVGVNYSATVNNCYSTGAASGNSYVGGLAGRNEGDIISSYSAGSVSATGTYFGGLVGYNSGVVNISFWNSYTAGTQVTYGIGYNSGTGDASNVGAIPLNNDEMTSIQNFDDYGWSISNAGGSTATWRIYENYTYPLLRSFLAPVIVTANNDSKTFDGAPYYGGNGVTYSTGSWDAKYLGSIAYGGDSQGAIDANNYVITPYGYFSDQQGYDITFVNGTLTINPAALTVITGSLTGSVSKVYDGTNVATLGPSNYLLDGWVGTDGATVTKTTGTYNDKNVGGGKTVTVSLASSDYSPYAGTNLSNYILPPSVTGNVGSITAAPLTLSTSAVTKVYDGGLTAAGAATVTGGTLFTGDTLSGGTYAFMDKNAGIGNKTVTVTGVTVNDGYGGNNYDVTYVNNTTSTINPAALTVAAATNTKTYDGTTSATALPTITSGGLVGGDTADLSEAYADKNAGPGKTLIPLAVITDGNGGGNYAVTYINNTGIIDQAPLTLSTSAVTKFYDGGLTAAGTAIVTGGTLFTGDTLSGGTFAFTDKNAGIGNKTVTVSGVTVNDGNGGNNYNVIYADNTTSTITPANLTVSGANAENKVYDGTTAAAINGATLSGVIGTDVVTLGNYTTGTFADKNVGPGKSVSTAMTLSGADSGNYTLTQPAGLAAEITVAPLTLSTSAVTKVYDGGLTAAGTAIVTGGTLFTGDTLSGGTFAFTGKNVGMNKTVTASGVTVNDGNGGNNYDVIYVNNTTSTINPAALTVTANNASKTYDGAAYSGGNGVTYSGFVGGENESVLSGTLDYSGNSQGAVNAGTYMIHPFGLTSENYAIRLVNGTLTINTSVPTVTPPLQNIIYAAILDPNGPMPGILMPGDDNQDDSSLSGQDNRIRQQACPNCSNMFPNLHQKRMIYYFGGGGNE